MLKSQNTIKIMRCLTREAIVDFKNVEKSNLQRLDITLEENWWAIHEKLEVKDLLHKRWLWTNSYSGRYEIMIVRSIEIVSRLLK